MTVFDQVPGAADDIKLAIFHITLDERGAEVGKQVVEAKRSYPDAVTGQVRLIEVPSL